MVATYHLKVISWSVLIWAGAFYLLSQGEKMLGLNTDLIQGISCSKFNKGNMRGTP